MFHKKAFTLIELILVMAILAILAGAIIPNFINSLKKGRDARRKQDLLEVQKAVELYYEDQRQYPTANTEIKFDGTKSLVDPNNPTKYYMQKLPVDPTSGRYYRYCVGSTKSVYALYAYLENQNDTAIITPNNLSGFSATCTTNCSANNCNYGISSTNTTP